MDKISFGASIKIDYQKLQKGLLCDKYFLADDAKSNIVGVIKQIERFSEMEEPSIVNITPRLDHNQLNLICYVTDSTGNIKETIWERSGRKIADNSDFAERFVSNIKMGIKNVQIVQRDLEEIKNIIKHSKTLIDSNFSNQLPRFMLDYLKKGYNPKKRIISILEQIENNYPETQNVISIQKLRLPVEIGKQSHMHYFFCLENKEGLKKISMPSFLKDPSLNLFI